MFKKKPRRLSYILDKTGIVDIAKTNKEKRRKAKIDLNNSLQRRKKINKSKEYQKLDQKYSFNQKQRERTRGYLNKILKRSQEDKKNFNRSEADSTKALTVKSRKYKILSMSVDGIKLKQESILQDHVIEADKNPRGSSLKLRKIKRRKIVKDISSMGEYKERVGRMKQYFMYLHRQDKLKQKRKEDFELQQEIEKNELKNIHRESILTQEEADKNHEEETYGGYELCFDYDQDAQKIIMKKRSQALGIAKTILALNKLVDDFISSWEMLKKSESISGATIEILSKIAESNMFSPILTKVEYGERPVFTRKNMSELLRVEVNFKEGISFEEMSQRISLKSKSVHEKKKGFFLLRKKISLRKKEAMFTQKLKVMSGEYYNKYSTIQRQILKISKEELENTTKKAHRKFIKQRLADLIEISMVLHKIVAVKKEDFYREQYLEYQKRVQIQSHLSQNIAEKYRSKFWEDSDFSKYYDNLKGKIEKFNTYSIKSKMSVFTNLSKYEYLNGPLEHVSVQAKLFSKAASKYYSD